MAVTFFVLASTTVHFARFSGGVAMVWVAGAMLAGRLIVLPERQWTPWLLWSGVASVMVTGLYGLGWLAAVPFAVVNVAEAAAAALIWRRITEAFWPDETVEWLAAFYIGIGLSIPLASGGVATLVAWAFVGLPPVENFLHWIVGHALGLIACLPVFTFIYRRAERGRSILPSAEALPVSLLVLFCFALLTGLVFVLDMRALLVFPLLFFVVGTAVLEEETVVFFPILLILIGGTLTGLDMGPIAQMDVDYGDRIQFFQLYVGVAVLAALPISCERTRRLQELRVMRERLALFEGSGNRHPD